jgi:PAS domain S-box-containing protein
MRVRDLDAGLDDASIGRLMQRVSAGETITAETRDRRKDGTEFPVEVRASAYEQGGRRLHLTLVRDISERRRVDTHCVCGFEAGLTMTILRLATTN